MDPVESFSPKGVDPGRLGEIAFRHHAAALATGQPRSYEIQLPIQGGERLVRTSLRPVCDQNGKARHLIGSSTDITGNHIMQRMQVSAATMNAEAEDFVALAAHDLRAPLRRVTIIADMLRDGFVDMGDGKLELIDMLETLGLKAMELISDVLSHAEATSVAPHNSKSTFDFGDLVRELMALLDPTEECRCRIDEGQIQGDRVVMQVVLRNLIDNTLKYAGKLGGVGQLQLSFTLKDCNDGFVEIGVEDNGKGFDDPAILFVNEGKLRTGTGFGLFAVHRLVRARDGTMSAENVKGGQGARVGFRLPGNVVPAGQQDREIRTG